VQRCPYNEYQTRIDAECFERAYAECAISLGCR
jgi:hypothetical protein